MESLLEDRGELPPITTSSVVSVVYMVVPLSVHTLSAPPPVAMAYTSLNASITVSSVKLVRNVLISALALANGIAVVVRQNLNSADWKQNEMR